MNFVPDYISKLVNNLLSNALKFTPPYGKVGVMIWREGRNFFLDVKDTGKGMTRKTQEQIFDPFFHAEDDVQNIGKA